MTGRCGVEDLAVPAAASSTVQNRTVSLGVPRSWAAVVGLDLPGGRLTLIQPGPEFPPVTLPRRACLVGFATTGGALGSGATSPRRGLTGPSCLGPAQVAMAVTAVPFVVEVRDAHHRCPRPSFAGGSPQARGHLAPRVNPSSSPVPITIAAASAEAGGGRCSGRSSRVGSSDAWPRLPPTGWNPGALTGAGSNPGSTAGAGPNRAPGAGGGASPPLTPAPQ